MTLHATIDRNGRQSSQEDILLEAVKRLLLRARSEAITGKGNVEIEFHQGGITAKRLGLTWIEK